MSAAFGKQLIELGDRAAPEGLVARDPVLRFLQRLAAQTEAVQAALHRAFDQAGLLEHLQVPGNRRLCRTEPAAQIAGTLRLATRKRVDHCAPRAVGQGAERAVETSARLHSQVTICQPNQSRKTAASQLQRCSAVLSTASRSRRSE